MIHMLVLFQKYIYKISMQILYKKYFKLLHQIERGEIQLRKI